MNQYEIGEGRRYLLQLVNIKFEQHCDKMNQMWGANACVTTTIQAFKLPRFVRNSLDMLTPWLLYGRT